eukprot:282077-Pelagomonas_calceolata.AAC.6
MHVKEFEGCAAPAVELRCLLPLCCFSNCGALSVRRWGFSRSDQDSVRTAGVTSSLDLARQEHTSAFGTVEQLNYLAEGRTPCNHCNHWIRNTGIKEVWRYYTVAIKDLLSVVEETHCSSEPICPFP